MGSSPTAAYLTHSPAYVSYAARIYSYYPTHIRSRKLVLLNNVVYIAFKVLIDNVEFVDNEFRLDKVELPVKEFIILNNVVDVAFKSLIDNVQFVDKLFK